MKKIGVWAFLFVLLFSGVNGEINTDSFESTRYNLGERITLEGYVQDSEGFIGNLDINSVCGNVTKPVFFTSIEVEVDERYEISQTFPIKESMLGNCYFQLELEDDEGNVLETHESEEFEITKELRIEAESNVLSQKPGEEVIISGVVRRSNGLRVEGGSVVLTLNGKIYAKGLSNGAFSHVLELPLSIDSGVQEVDIQARDLEGNEGDGAVDFKVLSVPRELVIKLDKDSYTPGEDLLVEISLNDQSGKNIQGSSTLQLSDPNGNEDLTQVVENGESFRIPLSSVSLPGTWILEAQNKELEDSKKFFVESVKTVDTSLNGNILIITNAGNVDYNDPVQINLKDEDGEDYQVIKKTSLKPNQTITVDLNKEVPGGSYEVRSGGELITGNVVVEGSAIGTLKNNSFIGYVALIFVFLFLILIVISKGKSKLSKRESAREKGKEILSKIGKEEVVLKRKEEKVSKQQKEDIDHIVNKVKEENPVDKTPKKEEDKPNFKGNDFFGIFD